MPVVKQDASPPPVWIDSNEEAHHHWSREFKMMGFNPIVMPMEVGDFRIMAMDYLWVIERKKAPEDLDSSFTDGRLANQFFHAQDDNVERFILLIEGDPNTVVLDPNIKNTLIQYQAQGVFVDFCRIGGVPERIFHLERYLSKPEHSYLRRPPLPQPGEFRYTDRDLRARVQTLLTMRGVGERAIRDTLRRYTLGEILAKPLLIMEVNPHVPRGVIRNAYIHLQLPVPVELETPSMKKLQQMHREERRKMQESAVEINRGAV